MVVMVVQELKSIIHWVLQKHDGLGLLAKMLKEALYRFKSSLLNIQTRKHSDQSPLEPYKDSHSKHKESW